MTEPRICAHCWDWIWPDEETYTDAQGRAPICKACHVKASGAGALHKGAPSTPQLSASHPQGDCSHSSPTGES